MAAFSRTWRDSEVDALVDVWSNAMGRYLDKHVVLLRFVHNALSTCQPCKNPRDITKLARSDICHCDSITASWSFRSSDACHLLAAPEHNQNSNTITSSSSKAILKLAVHA